MEFKSSPAPYLRSKKTTLQIMVELCIGLSLVWIFGIIYSFIAGGVYYGIKAIFNMVVAILVSLSCDVLTAVFKHSKDKNIKDEILDLLNHNYSYVSGAILVLTLPVWTPMYVIILGSIFATAIVKNVFGGFGKNIFNPAALGRIFIVVCFQGQISSQASGLEALSSGSVTTLTNAMNNWLGGLPSSYSLPQILFGTYFGALGETPTLLILLIGIIFSLRHDINWRTPVFYLGTVLVSSLFTLLVLQKENIFGVTLEHLCLGGVMFGAVFMLTDPVTGPTSNFGKSLIGVFAGFITMVIRFSTKSPYPEGVIFAIALSNIISPVIDYYTVGKSSSKLPLKYGIVFGGIIFTMLISLLIASRGQNKSNTTSYANLNNEYSISNVINIESNDINYSFSLKEVR